MLTYLLRPSLGIIVVADVCVTLCGLQNISDAVVIVLCFSISYWAPTVCQESLSACLSELSLSPVTLKVTMGHNAALLAFLLPKQSTDRLEHFCHHSPLCFWPVKWVPGFIPNPGLFLFQMTPSVSKYIRSSFLLTSKVSWDLPTWY